MKIRVIVMVAAVVLAALMEGDIGDIFGRSRRWQIQQFLEAVRIGNGFDVED